MELILIFAKFLEHTVFAPLWWITTYLAAYFYPLEDDYRQDFLALIFSALILIGAYVGYSYAYSSPTPKAAIESTQQSDPDLDMLKAQMETLKAVNKMNAGSTQEPEPQR